MSWGAFEPVEDLKLKEGTEIPLFVNPWVIKNEYNVQQTLTFNQFDALLSIKYKCPDKNHIAIVLCWAYWDRNATIENGQECIFLHAVMKFMKRIDLMLPEVSKKDMTIIKNRKETAKLLWRTFDQESRNGRKLAVVEVQDYFFTF